MSKLHWCKKRTKAVHLIEPNDNLAQEYYSYAEETLQELTAIKSNMWIATMYYYGTYFLAYALLMKIGIKSEIHSCTIELIKLLEQEEIIHHKLSRALEKTKDLRIQNQYYLKNVPSTTTTQEIIQLALHTKQSLDNITPQQIQTIRTLIQQPP